MSAASTTPDGQDERTLYRPKNVALEARQVTDDNKTEIADWCGGEHAFPDIRAYETLLVPDGTRGHKAAYVGDWVIRGVTGLFFVRTDADFRAAYEPAPPAAAGSGTEGNARA